MPCDVQDKARRILQRESEGPLLQAHEGLEQLAERLEELEDLVTAKDQRIEELERELAALKEAA